jgi:hypothetical protein
MPTNFTSPVGRLVQGDAFKPNTTDMQGAPLTIKTGPNAGQARTEWFVALAFAKSDPAWPAFKALIDAEARLSWPHLYPTPGGPCVLPTFSDKVVDGDGFDDRGRPFNRLPGFAGHWVVRFTNGFPPQVVKSEGGAWREARPEELKRGFYGRVAGTIKSNDNAQKPGLHMNWSKFAIDGIGPEIVVGPTAEDAFGAAGGSVALPPGASHTPVATGALSAGPTMLPAAGGVTYEAMIAAGWTDAALIAAGMMAPPPAAAPAPAPAPVPPMAAPVPPAAPAAPAYDGYRAGPAPAPPAPAPTPPAAPVRVMLPAAGGASYEAMLAAGWTDATLVAHGMMQGPPA